MKKLSYLLSGVLIGALVATSGSAVAAQVKSLVGQKVTGEYKVVVNGEELQDKGAVISGRTNAPVRAISESLGADLKVDNKTKTITITTQSEMTVETENKTPSKENKYIGSSKENLEELKYSIENRRLKPAIEEREFILKEIEILKTSGMNGEPAPGLAAKERKLKEYDDIIAKDKEELRLVEEALAAIK